MIESVAVGLVRAAGIYLAIGVVFGIAFVLRGAGRIDPSARNGTWGFRVLILPGAMALWPLLAKRWFGGSTTPPAERNAHRDAAQAADGDSR